MEVLQLGVRGVISKQSPVPVLVRCMRSVMAGQYWVGRDSVDNIIEALRRLTSSPKSQPKAKNFGITPRELEVVAAVVTGRTNKVIAEELSLSEQTVKHQLTSIFDKLGVSGRLELAVFAANHGLVNSD
jgi:DNA-binding NarL/FixJ family response regulator